MKCKLYILLLFPFLAYACIADSTGKNVVLDPLDNKAAQSDKIGAQVDQKNMQSSNIIGAELGQWELLRTLERPGVTAKGIASWLEYTIITDAEKDSAFVIDHVKDLNFDSLTVSNPMYVTVAKSRMLLPSYRGKVVNMFRGDDKDIRPLPSWAKLEGPIAVMGYRIDHYVILDQIQACLFLKRGERELKIGAEGSGVGELKMPTNFEVVDTSTFYVLDNGNKRVQVFNEDGQALFNFGQEQNFENVTGITSDDSRIFVSDFDKGMIYVYDHKGKFLGEINGFFNNPSDLDKKDNVLYVANQNGPEIVLISEVNLDRYD